MSEFIRHGDVEALVLHVLKNLTPELAGMATPFRFSTDLRGYTEGMRWVVVSQEGTSKAAWNIINKPRIDFEVRSDSRSLSRDAAEILEASVFRAVGVSAHGCTLCSVKEETGITRVPDKEEDTSYRYLFSLRLVTMIHSTSLPSLPS